MIAKKKFKNNLDSSKNRIIIIPQLNFIIEKGVDRRRENLPTVNKIILLIFKEDG